MFRYISHSVVALLAIVMKYVCTLTKLLAASCLLVTIYSKSINNFNNSFFVFCAVYVATYMQMKLSTRQYFVKILSCLLIIRNETMAVYWLTTAPFLMIRELLANKRRLHWSTTRSLVHLDRALISSLRKWTSITSATTLSQLLSYTCHARHHALESVYPVHSLYSVLPIRPFPFLYKDEFTRRIRKYIDFPLSKTL